MREDVSGAIEEALVLLEKRDLVYFDHGATAWVCTIPPLSRIRLDFGMVRMMLMRSTDGVLICTHDSGLTAYVPGKNIAIDAAGDFIEKSRLPCLTNEDQEDEGCGDGVRTSPQSDNVIDLRGCFLEHQDIVRLSRGLAGNCFVTHLSLSGNHLQDSAIALLSDALLHNGCLQELTLSYNEVSAVGSTVLATALTDHRYLKLVDLMHNRIGRDGVLPWLGRTLRNNGTLLELRLTHNDVGDRHASELITALAPAPATEEEQIKSAIARRRTVATGAPVAAVAAAIPKTIVATSYANPTLLHAATDEHLPYNTTLTTLLMGNTGIGDEAAGHLRHVLTENRTITHLDVSTNKFSDRGHQSIAMGLAGNHSLRYFNYCENHIEEPATAVALLNALRQHSSIETALFQDCFSGSHPATAMASLLRTTETLKTIDLSHCSLEAPGVVDLFRAIGENATLLNLDMTCMGIKSDQAVAVLSKSVESNRYLRYLNLSYNEITLRGCKLLRDASSNRSGAIMVSLEGNSGEKGQIGVHISGGTKPARPPLIGTA